MFLKAFGQNEVRVEGRVARVLRCGASANRQAARQGLVLSPSPRAPRRSKGFTLLEMLAVIVLLGIVGVIVARSVSGRVDTGKWDAGKIGVTKLDQDVQAYALDNGSPPKSLDDLITKPLNAPSWNGPYAKPADLNDPFGHPYGYLYPGKHGQYDIIFFGRDGKPGGEGIDRDYGNWQ
ncbi:MAG: General secretion pathway protein G [Rhodanobacteraceae bacterium]|nr:MAG: General secretion pathway protein G [Rhodanobacteraceae bacterium]